MTMFRSLAVVAVVTTLLPSPCALAQGPIDAGPPRTVVIPIEPARPAGKDAYLPQAPASLLEEMKFNKHKHRVVPEGQGGLPLPNSAEVQPAEHSPQAGPGDFRYFLNEPVQPAGAGISGSLVEPAGAVNRDVVLYTGNTFAALSKDSGKSWTHINPSTRFPAPDGPMCCDQRVIHVPSPNMTLWLLEYRYSSSKGTGSLRIAFAKGRDELRKNVFASFVVNPKTFGFGNGFFLDYSDLTYGSKHLYGSAIVAPGGTTGSISYVLWRAALTDVYDGGNVAISYYTAAALGGYGNYRFAQGSTSNMYWAAHESTTILRVYKWNETSGNASIFRKTISKWSATPTPAPGPDARDWTGFRWTNNCVLGGYANSSEVGFLWTSGSVSGRPRNFVRVARFNPTTLALIGQRDIHSANVAYHFPYAATNSSGHIGVTICFGGGKWYPSAGAFIIDNYTSWAGLSAVETMRTGKAGPPSNRWGDYFHCWRNSNLTSTWSGMGFTKQSATGSGEPRYVWFGREVNQPTWVNLYVQSTPATGVKITLPQLDRLGRGDGLTNFSRSYAPNQGYELTAPLTHLVGRTTYAFERWLLRTAPTAGFVNQPIGKLDLSVSNIVSLDDTAIARYVIRRVLNVRSLYASNVPITVSVTDINGKKNGATNFTRFYRNAQALTLTAPAIVGGRRFYRWRLNNANQPAGNKTLSVSMTATHTADAVYGYQTVGTYASFGVGCAGSNGTPSQKASGTPEVGFTPVYSLVNGPIQSAALFSFGFSRTAWGKIPLPFLLPGTKCAVYNDLVFTPAVPTNRNGNATLSLPLPNIAALIGQHYYSQFICVDPKANSWGLTMTNDIDTKIGGWVFQ